MLNAILILLMVFFLAIASIYILYIVFFINAWQSRLFPCTNQTVYPCTSDLQETICLCTGHDTADESLTKLHLWCGTHVTSEIWGPTMFLKKFVHTVQYTYTVATANMFRRQHDANNLMLKQINIIRNKLKGRVCIVWT